MFGNIIKGIKGDKDKDKEKDKDRKQSVSPAVINNNSNGGTTKAPIASEDLGQQFASLLDELGVPDAKKAEMQAWSNDKKWVLLMQHKDKIRDAEEKAKQNGTLYDTPQYFLSAMRENAAAQNQKLISELRVCLGSNPMSWINSFLQLGGFVEILKIFQTFQLKPEKDKTDFLIMSDCVTCIKSLLNSTNGLKSVMATSHTFKLLILCLDLTYPPELRSLILSLTAALSLVPKIGHDFVLEAVENFRQSTRERTRFQTIVEGAKQVAKSQLQFEYWTSFMTFVNSVVNSPVDLQTRVSLRSEFTALELIELVKPSRGKHSELDTQLDVFFECLEEDSEEMDSAYTDVNIRSPTEVSSKLDAMLQQSPALHHHFLSILRCLYTLASTQSDLGGKQWNLLDEAVGSLLSDPTRQSQSDRIDTLTSENRKLIEQIEHLKHSAAATAATAATPAPTVTVVQQQQPQVDTTVFTDKIKNLTTSLDEMKSDNQQLNSKINELDRTIKSLEQQLASRPKSTNEPSPSPNTLTAEPTTPDITNSEPIPSSGGPPPPPPPPGGAPPPPPPPGGAPPPPPPPPGGAGGPPPPPPPPGGKKSAAPGAPAAPTGPNLPSRKTPPTPSVKMVGLQWKKVNNNIIENSMWMNAKEFSLNDQFKGLEELFQVKKPAAAKPMEAGGGPLAGSSVGSPTKPAQAISILDIKRSQAISIMLSRFKMPLADLAKAINQLDETRLTLEDAKSLSKFTPTPEEVELLREEDFSSLGKPEQFLYEMSKVTRINEKLDCFIFKQKLRSQIEELSPDVQVLLKASNELKESKHFQKLLEIILSLGNFINGGTPRGDVYGFKLDSLSSLAEMRSPVDNKITLLVWLIQFLEQKHPDLLHFHEQLSNCEDAKRVSVQTIKSELGGLRKGLNQVKQEVEVSEGAAKTVLSNFLGQATDSVGQLEKQSTLACDSFSAVVAYFGEDSKTATPEEFFANISKFKSEFKRTHEQMLKERENANKAAAKKLAGASASTGSPKPPTPGGFKPPAGALPMMKPTSPVAPSLQVQYAGGEDDDDHAPNGQFMESLMSSMRGGQAIRISRRCSAYIGAPGQNQTGIDALRDHLKKTTK
ncbi:actin binding protein [Heterostelium album PN500]|uniref:Actin binding protein n=1 Tax=Heterostelium pallidum (strain ATCC 26659 / Pp 5 / PN500) TaxID=670386 RepID=D3BLH1_HETP5|nr:actin binding protein [Heterostelium album PN500]EFA77748.1 actin binding protein [Heterostelium album PN500]|eukprot:XP_020429876.1 actin binding protein [Heterostelium album PN500]